jgi:hypothetical protein
MRNKVYRLYRFLVAVCLIVIMISPASAVPIIPDPGVSTDKSSICCGDEITVVVPVKNLRSVTKYLHIDIVIKNPSGSKIVDDSKPETIAAYASKTFQYTYTIPEPCTSFGTYTVEVRVMEGETLHDSDTTTFQVSDCNGGDEDCDTQLTYDTSKQDRPSITYADNYFYVAYRSWETGESYNGDIFLKKFDYNWNEVKKEQITNSQYYQDSPSLVFVNNKLYVALITNHQGATWDDYDVYLKEYDSNLNYISDSGRYLTTLESCQDMPSLFYKDGYFYLAYQSWETGSSYNGDIYIKKFDSSWNEIKKVRVTSETSVQDRPSVIYADGYFYIAYHSKETGSWDIFVKKLDTSLNLQSWKKQVTSESSSQSYPSINFVNNEYAIAYASNEGGTLGIYIKKYDSNWGFIEKVKVIDDGSVHEKRPSMVHALGDYQLAYVRYLEGSDDFNIHSSPEECSSDEEPSPEIIEVSYPSTCVNEGDYVPISVTVRNNGGASSEGYISVSFPNDEDVPESDVSGTGNGYNELFPKGYYPLWTNDGERITAIDPLVELFEANWGKGQQETITMKVKPNSGSDEIVFYVRAALKNDADGSYERDPTYSGDSDQQGWHVERHVIEMCSSSEEIKFRGTVTGQSPPQLGAIWWNVTVDEVISGPQPCSNEITVSVFIYPPYGYFDPDITVGDKVEVYGKYYAQGECYVSLNGKEDYYLRTVEDNTPVKFIGEITGELTPISFYEFDVRVDEIISDPSGKLEVGETVSVWAHRSAFTIEAGVGDRVEVFGLYKGTFIDMDKIQLEDSAHFLEEQPYRWIKTDENAKFDCGTNNDYFTVSFYADWLATQITIAAETGENLRSRCPVISWLYDPPVVSKYMRSLDASKGMIELWPNKYDENDGVKTYYRITTHATEKDKFDRIAWISANGDLVLLTGENKDFVMKVWGENTDGYFTSARIYGGTDRFNDGLLMNWEGNVTKFNFKEGDEINLDVPSGSITMKILELKWAPPQYDRIFLEKVEVDYEIVLQDPPNLIVTGGLPYYAEPLQVFLSGSEVHGLQQPQVSVQNPDEYTYIVEYWNDTNNDLVIDGGDKWEKEPTFNDITNSDPEFDLLFQDLPIGLYRVKIDGTDYMSNNFYVILNPFDTLSSLPFEKRIEYEANYWVAEESGYRDCSGIGLTGIPYIICKIMFTLKPHSIPTNIRNHDGEMLMIMASNWREHHINIINEEEYIIEEFNTFLLNSMTRAGDLTPTPSPEPPEDIIEYVNAIKSSSSDPPIGDCDCFAVFLVALGRTSGIPSRMVFANGDDRVEGPGKWGHGWAEMYYNGEWHVWDPYNRLSVCGGPYRSNYIGYANCLLRESTSLTKLNFIVDEHNFDRSPDYGITLPEAIISSIKCPANLHAYDSQGRHVGVNELGGIDLEIPSAYYTGPDSEPENIVIFNQNDDIIFKIEALDSGEFNFTLAQSTETQTTTVTYLDVPITETTEATVDVSEANPTYTMEIDKYGDGTAIETIEPDSIETGGQPSIQLHTGWNLISIPLVPEGSNIDSVFSTISGAYSVVWTTTSTGGWKSSNQAFGKLTDITVDRGYLIYMTAPDTLVIEGTEPASTTINLASGWNLVGYPAQTTRSITDVLSGVSYDVVWTTTSTGGWKSSDQAFGRLTDMSPGNGYMIYAPVSGSYTVD